MQRRVHSADDRLSGDGGGLRQDQPPNHPPQHPPQHHQRRLPRLLRPFERSESFQKPRCKFVFYKVLYTLLQGCPTSAG